jgi:predicted transcriptional regulator
MPRTPKQSRLPKDPKAPHQRTSAGPAQMTTSHATEAPEQLTRERAELSRELLELSESLTLLTTAQQRLSDTMTDCHNAITELCEEKKRLEDKRAFFTKMLADLVNTPVSNHSRRASKILLISSRNRARD